MGMGMSVRMSAAWSMHSIARNSTCSAHGMARAHSMTTASNMQMREEVGAKHKRHKATQAQTYKMHACAQSHTKLKRKGRGRQSASQSASQSVSQLVSLPICQ